MVVVGIAGILAALASSALTGLRRQARASGQARLLVYRLQSARTLSVSQGWPQGYYFGAPGDATPVMSNAAVPWCEAAGCGFSFKALTATGTATYLPNNGQEEYPLDPLPYASNSGGPAQLLAVAANGVATPSFTVGFDLNGLPRHRPAAQSHGLAHLHLGPGHFRRHHAALGHRLQRRHNAHPENR